MEQLQDLNKKFAFQVERYNRIMKDLHKSINELKCTLPSLINLQRLSDDNDMTSESKRLANNIKSIIHGLEESKGIIDEIMEKYIIIQKDSSGYPVDFFSGTLDNLLKIYFNINYYYTIKKTDKEESVIQSDMSEKELISKLEELKQ